MINNEISIEQLLDEMKMHLVYFSDVKNPLLQNYIIKFGIFYEKNLKYREVINKGGDKLKVGELKERCKEVNIDFSKHSNSRVELVGDFAFYSALFLTEKMKPSKASASILELSKKLKMDKIALESEFEIDEFILGKSLSELSDAEYKAIDFNFTRILRTSVVANRLKELEPFLENYNHILPDQKFIEELRKYKPLYKKEQIGFNLGYNNDQLKILFEKLKDATFLPSNTNEEHFINAFTGQQLVENFNKLE